MSGLEKDEKPEQSLPLESGRENLPPQNDTGNGGNEEADGSADRSERHRPSPRELETGENGKIPEEEPNDPNLVRS